MADQSTIYSKSVVSSQSKYMTGHTEWREENAMYHKVMGKTPLASGKLVNMNYSFIANAVKCISHHNNGCGIHLCLLSVVYTTVLHIQMKAVWSLLFLDYPEDGNNRLLWKVINNLPIYKGSDCRWPASSTTLQWESHTSIMFMVTDH
jgi:hypothetical protein